MLSGQNSQSFLGIKGDTEFLFLFQRYGGPVRQHNNNGVVRFGHALEETITVVSVGPILTIRPILTVFARRFSQLCPTLTVVIRNVPIAFINGQDGRFPVCPVLAIGPILTIFSIRSAHRHHVACTVLNPFPIQRPVPLPI